MTRPVPLTRGDFRQFMTAQTRLNDNDEYGHLYNVTYLELFDNAINGWMKQNGMQDFRSGEPIAVVAENGCTYLRSVAFPDVVQIGLRVTRIGTSSLTFQLAMFRDGDDAASAQGHVTMVFVKVGTHSPCPPPAHFRERLEMLRTG